MIGLILNHYTDCIVAKDYVVGYKLDESQAGLLHIILSLSLSLVTFKLFFYVGSKQFY